MTKQVVVIGLGRFGISITRALVDRGIEVLAADVSEERVKAASEIATEAVILDATDSDALGRLAPERRDLCVCAIGDDSSQAATLCTALLREMGAKRIVARASDPLQERILRRVGAHEVVDPLRDFGTRFATHLLHERILGELPLGQDLVITEMRPTSGMVGRTLSEMDLPRRQGITVVAIRAGNTEVLLPDPERALTESDVLIVVSRPEAVAAMVGQDPS